MKKFIGSKKGESIFAAGVLALFALLLIIAVTVIVAATSTNNMSDSEAMQLARVEAQDFCTRLKDKDNGLGQVGLNPNRQGWKEGGNWYFECVVLTDGSSLGLGFLVKTGTIEVSRNIFGNFKAHKLMFE